MPRWVVQGGRTSIRYACHTVGLSETCHQYAAKRDDENAIMADWLVRLVAACRDWDLDFFFLHPRNVKGFRWNHKRVYRIYRVREQNLRIKPKKRLAYERPETLAVPLTSNETWSIDFMHDQLSNGHGFRAFNVIDDFRR